MTVINNPLRLTPSQWRIMRYLGSYSASATRVGFRADQLCEHTSTEPADLGDLADSGYIAGRERGSAWEPAPDVVRDATNPKRLNVHITTQGKKAATILEAATFALLHLRVHGSLPTDFLRGELGTDNDTLARLERCAYTQTIPGDHLAWHEGSTVRVYQAQQRIDPHWTCTSCNALPRAGATIWVDITDAPIDRHCDPCARRKAKVAVPSALVTLTKLGRRYSDPYMIEVGS
ncbi:hypothetical protein AB0F17_16990 [Nonomuraea sp. NPDC026600]|uniref:hypothetical protein n=1 Tax=Nonomuraea sp. NPDC026600 TaxID=3155363 RepID=UPI00340D6649